MVFTPIARSRIHPSVQRFCRFMMKALGWGVVGGECPVNKAVIAAAPHRSNWDLFYTLLSAGASNVPMWFMMKNTLFFWPLSTVWWFLGGVPINRKASSSVVSQMVKALNKSERMYLVITPEGTRKEVDYWTTGFYYIAHEAGIPIWPWFINYKTKRTGSGDIFYTTGDIQADFEHLRKFYEENEVSLPSCRPKPRKHAQTLATDKDAQPADS